MLQALLVGRPDSPPAMGEKPSVKAVVSPSSYELRQVGVGGVAVQMERSVVVGAQGRRPILIHK